MYKYESCGTIGHNSEQIDNLQGDIYTGCFKAGTTSESSVPIVAYKGVINIFKININNQKECRHNIDK